MIELPYSLVIEATEEPDYFGFYSPDLEGFSGIGHSVEDCLFKAKWGMKEHIQLLKEQGLPVPPKKSDPRIVIQNEKKVAVGWSYVCILSPSAQSYWVSCGRPIFAFAIFRDQTFCLPQSPPRWALIDFWNSVQDVPHLHRCFFTHPGSEFAFSLIPKAVEGKASIQRDKGIWLECGKEFRRIAKSHPGSHVLTPREYKEKHGIPPGKALISKDLSAKRRKVAKEKGLGKKLTKVRKKRAKA
jgi:predicted RNase H-like HicB family nuclease